jgi:hypothetical protein
VIAWLLSACGAACPPGTSADPSREAELRARLAELEPALARTRATVCTGAPQDGLAGDRVLLADASDPAAAARLGHLLLHRRDGLLPPTPGPACAAEVERALAGERAAHAAEAGWRRAWGLPPSEQGPEAHAGAYAARCDGAQGTRTTR